MCKLRIAAVWFTRKNFPWKADTISSKACITISFTAVTMRNYPKKSRPQSGVHCIAINKGNDGQKTCQCNNTLTPLSCLFHKTNFVTYLTCKVLRYIIYAIGTREWRHNLQRAPNARKDRWIPYGTCRWQRCQPYTPAVFTPPTLDTPGTYFCWRLSRLQCHTAAGRNPSGIEPATSGL